jgi:FkbM family methyltransferase
MKKVIKRGLAALGYEVRRLSVHTSPGVQLNRLITHLGIDLVLDVGANTGQYAQELRAQRYAGAIVSFEPLATAHARLLEAARRDPRWRVAPRMALGSRTAEVTLNVAGNSLSSSVLRMLPAHEQAAPGSGVVGTEAVALHRLDEVAGQYLGGANAVLLKIDTQGYEDQVLAGAAGVLDRVTAVQLELSFEPLYEGQPLFDAMRGRLRDIGFSLVAMFPGYVDPLTGRTLQVDGFFVRTSRTAASL